jgi:uncharacterized membrane protein
VLDKDGGTRETDVKQYVRIVTYISLLCLVILAAAFYASWIKFWGDQNWFARAGGIVTFVGGWFVLVADRHRFIIDDWIRRTHESVDANLRKVAEEQPDLVPYLETVKKEWYEQNDIRIPTDFRSPDLEASIPSLRYRRRVRMFELSLLGVGTIIWALGDMVQFIPR